MKADILADTNHQYRQCLFAELCVDAYPEHKRRGPHGLAKQVQEIMSSVDWHSAPDWVDLALIKEAVTNALLEYYADTIFRPEYGECRVELYDGAWRIATPETFWWRPMDEWPYIVAQKDGIVYVNTGWGISADRVQESLPEEELWSLMSFKTLCS